MRRILLSICVLALIGFSASANTLPEEQFNADTVYTEAEKCAAEEIIQLGDMLRYVAQQLGEDEELNAASEEYFLRDLWRKTKAALKNATMKVKVAVKGALKEGKDHLTEAAKVAKTKLKEKANEVVLNILSRTMTVYALEDSRSNLDIRRKLCNDIDRVGERLQKFGNAMATADK
ncbi:hypothetical protein HPB49_011249 [Dermacentor silvarum]|uniref:Uncharacterized protein n=1 Tax=Dermacentor silvarum TaxID=543639 RepID=A0ACB8DCP2_DERSI|nr:uncharacterized protein LOC125939609 [Dermacentor silvarum]KAH7965810.1 hypothetical protein HPB49_011249 [Dermacentor silvarum]